MAEDAAVVCRLGDFLGRFPNVIRAATVRLDTLACDPVFDETLLTTLCITVVSGGQRLAALRVGMLPRAWRTVTFRAGQGDVTKGWGG